MEKFGDREYHTENLLLSQNGFYSLESGGRSIGFITISDSGETIAALFGTKERSRSNILAQNYLRQPNWLIFLKQARQITREIIWVYSLSMEHWLA